MDSSSTHAGTLNVNVLIFQLHVMDSEERLLERGILADVLSTPCNGFLAEVLGGGWGRGGA